MEITTVPHVGHYEEPEWVVKTKTWAFRFGASRQGEGKMLSNQGLAKTKAAKTKTLKNISNRRSLFVSTERKIRLNVYSL